MADKLVEGGYRDAGYVSVHIDDCWEARDRDSNGRLVANQTRFPSGIKSLAEYVNLKNKIEKIIIVKRCMLEALNLPFILILEIKHVPVFQALWII